MEDIIRNLKINDIFNKELNISENRLKYINDDKSYKLSDVYSALKKNSDFILTGSYALYIYGLLDRKPQDFDVIISEENSKKYKLINNYSYFTTVKDAASIGYTIFDDVKFELFLSDDNTTYIEYDGIKIASPEYIIEKKVKMDRKKDNIDFIDIRSKLLKE